MRDREHRVDRRLAGVQLAPVLRARDRAVTAEREEHARRRGQAGRGAEELTDGGDEQHDAGHLRGERLVEDDLDAAAARGHRVRVLHREQEGEQQDPAADRRVEDRPPDALGRGVGGAVGLLRQVGGGVVAGDRVLREQEAERQHVEPEARSAVRTVERAVAAEQAAGVVDLAGEDVAGAPVGGPVLQEEDQDEHDDRGAGDVPPHRDVVEDREQVAGEDVDDRAEDQDAEEHEEDALERVALGPRRAEAREAVVEERGARRRRPTPRWRSGRPG